ncbi:MAG: hypothetical protein ACP5UM_12825 [Anaerolineae bacterium]
MGSKGPVHPPDGQENLRRGTPLRSIPDFPAERARQLAALWVTTAEEFLAMASTPRGQAGLSDLLEVSPEELEALVRIAYASLPEEVARTFSRPSSREFPLGAILPGPEGVPGKASGEGGDP